MATSMTPRTICKSLFGDIELLRIDVQKDGIVGLSDEAIGEKAILTLIEAAYKSAKADEKEVEMTPTGGYANTYRYYAKAETLIDASNYSNKTNPNTAPRSISGGGDTWVYRYEIKNIGKVKLRTPTFKDKIEENATYVAEDKKVYLNKNGDVESLEGGYVNFQGVYYTDEGNIGGDPMMGETGKVKPEEVEVTCVPAGDRLIILYEPKRVIKTGIKIDELPLVVFNAFCKVNLKTDTVNGYELVDKTNKEFLLEFNKEARVQLVKKPEDGENIIPYVHIMSPYIEELKDIKEIKPDFNMEEILKGTQKATFQGNTIQADSIKTEDFIADENDNIIFRVVAEGTYAEDGVTENEIKVDSEDRVVVGEGEGHLTPYKGRKIKRVKAYYVETNGYKSNFLKVEELTYTSKETIKTYYAGKYNKLGARVYAKKGKFFEIGSENFEKKENAGTALENFNGDKIYFSKYKDTGKIDLTAIGEFEVFRGNNLGENKERVSDYKEKIGKKVKEYYTRDQFNVIPYPDTTFYSEPEYELGYFSFKIDQQIREDFFIHHEYSGGSNVEEKRLSIGISEVEQYEVREKTHTIRNAGSTLPVYYKNGDNQAIVRFSDNLLEDVIENRLKKVRDLTLEEVEKYYKPYETVKYGGHYRDIMYLDNQHILMVDFTIKDEIEQFYGFHKIVDVKCEVLNHDVEKHYFDVQ